MDGMFVVTLQRPSIKTVVSEPDIIYGDKVVASLRREVIRLITNGVIDGVTDGVKNEVIKTIVMIYHNEGLNAGDIAVKLGKPKPSVERYLRLARKLGIITFKGVPRTGGYYLAAELNQNT